MTGSETRSRRGLVLGPLVALLVTGAGAAPAPPPDDFSPAAARASDAGPKVFQFALQNGMQVLVIPDHRAPVVTQMLWFKAGAVDDPPGLSGLAHFVEQMMFRGTRALPGEGYAETIALNGGETSALTTHDYTVFYDRVGANSLKIAMDLEADRLANLDLTDAAVAAETDAALGERRMGVADSPEAELDEQLEAVLHLSHPYGRPVLGWPDEVRRIDRVAARDFYRRRYAPNNALLIIAGDVTPASIRDLAQKEYGKVGARELAPRAEFTEPAHLGPTRIAVVRPGVRIARFRRIYRVPSYAQAAPGQAEAFETLARVLGGDRTAALYRILVVQKRLATEAIASYDGYARDGGGFTVTAVPRPGVSLDALERATDAVIESFAKNPPPAVDLARARTELVAGTLYRRDDPFALATAYGRALMIGLTADDVNAWPERIRAVTGDDVRDAARLLEKSDAVTGTLEAAP